MNGSVRCARGVTLGCLAVLAVAAGCSREARPARQAAPTPTFESRVGEGVEEPGMEGAQPGMQPGMQQPGMQHPEMGQPGIQQPGMQQPPGWQQGQPGMPKQPGMQQPPGWQQGQPGTQPGAQPPQPGMEPQPGAQPPGAETAAPMTERAMCEQLFDAARVRTEDVTGGVAIVLAPKAGAEMGTVREHARRVEQMIAPGAAAAPPSGAPAEWCELFDLGRQAGQVSVTETPNAIRLVITSGDAGAVKSLRAQARSFVKTWSAQSGEQKGP